MGQEWAMGQGRQTRRRKEPVSIACGGVWIGYDMSPQSLTCYMLHSHLVAPLRGDGTKKSIDQPTDELITQCHPLEVVEIFGVGAWLEGAGHWRCPLLPVHQEMSHLAIARGPVPFLTPHRCRNNGTEGP